MTAKAMLGGFVGVLLLTGCRYDMQDQPKFKPLARSDFFADERSARPPAPGTIPRGGLRMVGPLNTGMQDGRFIEMPVPVTRALIERGHERFDIFCSPCHGRVGNGAGMVAQRGFYAPASFHSDRMRRAPDGYIFAVISNGYGAMSSYASQIPIEDRWAITAYIRALQFSRFAAISDLPAEDQARLATEQGQR